MKNNKIFNKKLFVDGIMQTRVIGIILSAVTVALYLMRSNNLMITRSYKNIVFYDYKSAFMIYGLFVPIFMIWLFKQYFKRSSADLLDSVGVPKTATAISYSAAAVFWPTVMLIISTGLDLAYTSFQGALADKWSYILLCFVYSFVGILQTAAIWLTAVAITGKIGSCIVTAVSITYLPQLVLNEMLSFSACRNSAFAVYQTGNILAQNLNIAALPMFSLNSNGQILFDPKASQIIYSTVVFAIYSALGLFLFSKRSSETAEHTSCNGWLSSMIPALISLFIAVIGLNFKFSDALAGKYMWLFIVAAVVVYFVICLIMQRKSINIKPMIGGFLALCVVVGIIFGASFISYNKLSDTKLSVDEIKSVNWMDKKYNTGSNYKVLFNFNICGTNIVKWDNYFDYKLSEYEITDDTIKSSFTDFSKLYSNNDFDETYDFYSFNRNFVFKINTDKKSYYLQTNNIECMYYFIDKIYSDSNLKNIFINLPTPDSVKIDNRQSIYDNRIYSTLSQKQLLLLYESLNNEIKTVDYEKWVNAVDIENSNILGNRRTENSFSIVILTAEVKIDNEARSLMLPISNLTPKTEKMYLEYLKAAQSDNVKHILSGKSKLKSIEKQNINGVSTSCYSFNKNGDDDLQKSLYNYFKSVANEPLIGEYDYFYNVVFADESGKEYAVDFAADFDKMSDVVAAILNR